MSWDWQVFFQDTGGGQTYFNWMMSAWGWTLLVSGCALVVALVVGSIMGIFRTTPVKALVWIGNAWTELFRNIPLLVQIFLWYHVIPSICSGRCRQVPDFIAVVIALGFFTSARISEQVKAGIQALPRGQRYAGLAMGLTLPQTYRFVLLPMAFRIVIPPLTSESMNIIKNSSVAFAVSITELTFFAMQAQEETSRGVEIYLAVTFLYFISAFAVNRVAAVHREAGAGARHDRERQMNLSFGFIDWNLIQSFILKGFIFSVQLTLVAMVGGIALGTAIALMRLSGKKWLVVARRRSTSNTLRSIPLVMVILWFFLLIPLLIGRPLGAELSAMITFTVFEAAYYSEIMRAGIQSVPKGQVSAGYAVGMNYAQCMRFIVLPQAFRNMLPVLLTQTIILFQDTSLVYAVGAYDLLKGFEVAGKNFNRPVEMYLLAAVTYFVICFSLSMLVRKLQKKIAIIR